MKVKILTNYRTDKGEVSAMPEKEVDDEEGRRLILGGIAEEIGGKPRRARKAAEPETDSTESDHGDDVEKSAA